MGETKMTEQWTPTTEHVRATFAYITAGLDHDDGYAFNVTPRAEDFDRWLAAHDAKVAANALRDLALHYRRTHKFATSEHIHVGLMLNFLDARADRIEREATNHKPNQDGGA